MPRLARVRPWLTAALSAALVVLPLQAQSGTAGNATSGSNTQEGWNPEEILKAEKFVRPPAVVERIITAPRTDISFNAPRLRGSGPSPPALRIGVHLMIQS